MEMLYASNFNQTTVINPNCGNDENEMEALAKTEETVAARASVVSLYYRDNNGKARYALGADSKPLQRRFNRQPEIEEYDPLGNL